MINQLDNVGDRGEAKETKVDGVSGVGTEDVTSRSALLTSLPRGVRKFHSPTCAQKQNIFPMELRFVGVTIEEGATIDIVPQEPVSMVEKI